MSERASGPRARLLLSLRLSLGGAFMAIVLLTALLLGAILFSSVRTFIRNDLRARLRNAVGVAALQIDAREHERVRSRADEKSPAYLHIRRQLEAVRERSRDVRSIFTLRRDAAGRFFFVVDAEADGARVSHVGDYFTEPTSALSKVFIEKPYVAHAGKDFVTDPRGTTLSAFAPLLGPDGRIVAVLSMGVSASDAAAFERHFLLLALGALAGISLIVMLVSLVLTARLSKPLTDLAEDMGRIQKFDLDGGVEIRSRIAEIVQMKTSLDNMKMGLRSFKRYVPADLVSELIQLEHEAALGAENRPLTVLFSDIAGFTTISESLPSDRLSAALAVYFEGMTRAILDEGGTVDKFVGDAIMAFWGAPHPVADHAVRACRAALKCQEFLAERFGRSRREDEPVFATRIGINTGEAYVGNFGYRERLSYTAIGDSVNLASRLEGMNKHYGTRLLVSETTLGAVGHAFATRPIDRVAVKGRTHGVLVHELVAESARLSPAEADRLKRHAAAMRLYAQGLWAQAAEAFDALSKARPDDVPARILTERCAEFAAKPPPAGWDGVFVLHEK